MFYLSYSKSYLLKAGASEQIPAIILHPALLQLKEVMIKAKIIPIRLMKDTVEFNTDSYVIHDQDKVDDLLKQLPGVMVAACAQHQGPPKCADRKSKSESGPEPHY